MWSLLTQRNKSIAFDIKACNYAFISIVDVYEWDGAL